MHAIGMVLILASAGAVGAAEPLSSANHPRLARILREAPTADLDGDAALSLAEYRAWLEGEGAKRELLRLLPDGDVLVSDFEARDLGSLGWKAEGQAFRSGPEASTKLLGRRVGDYSGSFLVSSLRDPARRPWPAREEVGSLTSPEFELELEYLEFYLSGGAQPGRLAFQLIAEGRVLRSVTGENDDAFELCAFDCRDLVGQVARVRLIDEARGFWGHLNVDRIVQTRSTEAPRVISEALSAGGVPGRLQSFARSLRGELAVEATGLSVGEHHVPFDELLLALPETSAASEFAGALGLVDGERWAVELRKLEKGEITVRSELFGSRKVALERVASLEFASEIPVSAREPETLYRYEGEPIPGELVWLRQKDLAIDCPLGVLPIPRSLITHYVLRARAPLARRTNLLERAADELHLADGSILRGALEGGDGRPVFRHASLGHLELDWTKIASLRRTPPGLEWLDRLSYELLPAKEPVLSPPEPRWVERPGALATLRLAASHRIRFALPAKQTWSLRVRLAAVPGGAAARVAMVVGEESLWEGRFAPGAAPRELEIELPSAEDFTVQVAFGDRLGFPCGVDLMDMWLRADLELRTDGED